MYEYVSIHVNIYNAVQKLKKYIVSWANVLCNGVYFLTFLRYHVSTSCLSVDCMELRGIGSVSTTVVKY